MKKWQSNMSPVCIFLKKKVHVGDTIIDVKKEKITFRRKGRCV